MGGVYSTIVPPFESMGRLADVGLRIGMGYTAMTVGVVAGSPLSGAIFDRTGSYKNVGYWGGKSSCGVRSFFPAFADRFGLQVQY